MDERLLKDNGEIWLFFDDQGEQLSIGDRVYVNHRVETTVEGTNVHRWLKGLPPEVVIHSVERISSPYEDSWLQYIN